MLNLEIYENQSNFLLLDADQVSVLSKQLIEWECMRGKYLKKRYNFSSYLQAKHFVDGVAQFAETVNHHPQLLFGYKFVEVSIWTHNVDGLSAVDFAYAKDLDVLYLHH